MSIIFLSKYRNITPFEPLFNLLYFRLQLAIYFKVNLFSKLPKSQAKKTNTLYKRPVNPVFYSRHVRSTIKILAVYGHCLQFRSLVVVKNIRARVELAKLGCPCATHRANIKRRIRVVTPRCVHKCSYLASSCQATCYVTCLVVKLGILLCLLILGT